jgi:hypothetical protein
MLSRRFPKSNKCWPAHHQITESLAMVRKLFEDLANEEPDPDTLLPGRHSATAIALPVTLGPG